MLSDFFQNPFLNDVVMLLVHTLVALENPFGNKEMTMVDKLLDHAVQQLYEILGLDWISFWKIDCDVYPMVSSYGIEQHHEEKLDNRQNLFVTNALENAEHTMDIVRFLWRVAKNGRNITKINKNALFSALLPSLNFITEKLAPAFSQRPEVQELIYSLIYETFGWFRPLQPHESVSGSLLFLLFFFVLFLWLNEICYRFFVVLSLAE